MRCSLPLTRGPLPNDAKDHRTPPSRRLRRVVDLPVGVVAGDRGACRRLRPWPGRLPTASAGAGGNQHHDLARDGDPGVTPADGAAHRYGPGSDRPDHDGRWADLVDLRRIGGDGGRYRAGDLRGGRNGDHRRRGGSGDRNSGGDGRTAPGGGTGVAGNGDADGGGRYDPLIGGGAGRKWPPGTGPGVVLVDLRRSGGDGGRQRARLRGGRGDGDHTRFRGVAGRNGGGDGRTARDAGAGIARHGDADGGGRYGPPDRGGVRPERSPRARRGIHVDIARQHGGDGGRGRLGDRRRPRVDSGAGRDGIRGGGHRGGDG